MRALEHNVHQAGALRLQEFAGGVAYFNEELPLVWDVNFIRVDRPAVDLVGTVERLQADLGHFKVLIENGVLVEGNGPELIGRGLTRRGLVALAREPGGRLDPDVRELPYEQVKPFRFDV